MVIKKRFTSGPMIQQLDRELQYCSTIHPNKPVQQGIRIKSWMTDGYDYSQNALAESVNGILKNDFLIYKCNTGKLIEQSTTRIIILVLTWV